MSVFNRLYSRVSCIECGSESEMEIQFKYGDCWLFEYALGDALRWGANAQGQPGHRKVIASGFALCPVCDAEQWLLVVIERDVLERVEVSDGSYDFRERPYVVVEESARSPDGTRQR